MGNAIVHFKVEHHGISRIHSFHMQCEAVTHATIMSAIAAAIIIPPNLLPTVEYEARFDQWMSLDNDEHVHNLGRRARGKGTKDDPIRLRLLVNNDPAKNDIVYFDIPDADLGDVRFTLDREAVTLEALHAEAESRYGKGVGIRWASGERWIRLDSAKDMVYMLEHCETVAKDGRMSIQLKVRYDIDADGYMDTGPIVPKKKK